MVDRYEFFQAVKAELDKRIESRKKQLAGLNPVPELVSLACTLLTEISGLQDAFTVLPDFYRVSWTEERMVLTRVVEGPDELKAALDELNQAARHVSNITCLPLNL